MMPRSRSLNSSLAECLLPGGGGGGGGLCGSRLMQREALMFGGDQSGADLEDLMSALYRLTLPETSLPLRPVPATNRAMIWTEKEAVRKQVRLLTVLQVLTLLLSRSVRHPTAPPVEQWLCSTSCWPWSWSSHLPVLETWGSPPDCADLSPLSPTISSPGPRPAVPTKISSRPLSLSSPAS